MNRNVERASKLAGVQVQKVSDDNINAGVGVILFFPTLLWVECDGVEASELAKVKGRIDAIQTVISENCSR